MSDLICRQDAINACRSVVDNINSPTDQQIGAEYCLDLIKEISSAKSEQNKGEWIDEKPNMYTRKVYCSECVVWRFLKLNQKVMYIILDIISNLQNQIFALGVVQI